MIHKRSLSESRHRRPSSGSSLKAFERMLEADTVDGGGEAHVSWQDIKKTLKHNSEITSKLLCESLKH